MWVAWYLGLVMNGIVTTMAVNAAMPQATIKTLRQRQKKLMTSAKLRGLIFSAAINVSPFCCFVAWVSFVCWVELDVMGVLSQCAKITIQTRANA